jgi:hypothetical protein
MVAENAAKRYLQAPHERRFRLIRRETDVTNERLFMAMCQRAARRSASSVNLGPGAGIEHD